MALIDVIKYEGGNDVLVWKHPVEDFNSEAQLIVHETQVAIVFRNGQALDLYKPGKYTLKSENVPIVRSLISVVTNGISPNHCEVYFFNKAVSMNVFWGTTTPLAIQDPVYQVPFKVRSHGQFAISVQNSRKLLKKIVGTTTSFSQKELNDYFRGLLMTRIKDYISNAMVQEQKSFLEINSYLTEISDGIKAHLTEVFTNYGLGLEEFFVESINIEEDEVYTELRKSMGRRATRKMEGYDYATERGFNVAEAQAKNEGTSGNVAGMGVGLGVGLGAGQAMGGLMGQAMQPLAGAFQNTPYQGGRTVQDDNYGVLKPKPRIVTSDLASSNLNTCPHCKQQIPEGAKFCNSCGFTIQKSNSVCISCGAQLPLSAAFCHQCGQKVGG